MHRKCELLNVENFKNLIKTTKTILLDCDGVLHLGDSAVPGVAAVLTKLRAMGKRLFYVTNNSSKTRTQVAKKLACFNFPVSESNIINSGYSTAMYLKSRLNLKEDKVFCIGSPDLADELRMANLNVISPEVPEGEGGMQKAANYKLHPHVACVVIGNDEELTYLKIAEGMRYLLSKDHKCLFVATNYDSSYPAKHGLLLPGAGSCVRMLETAVNRTVDVVCGKPSATMLKAVEHEFDIDPNLTLMVGDRLDTDIEFANNCSMRSLLVMTGVATYNDIASIHNGDVPYKLVPDYYTGTLADLIIFLD